MVTKINLPSRPIMEYKVFTFETKFALLLLNLSSKAMDLPKVSIVQSLIMQQFI